MFALLNLGIRSKLYTYTAVDDLFSQNIEKKNLKKAKGVTKPIVKNHTELLLKIINIVYLIIR